MCIVWVAVTDAALPCHDPPPSFPRSQGRGVSSSKTHHPLQPEGMGGACAIAVGAIDPAPGIGTKAVRPASLHACRPHFKLEAHAGAGKGVVVPLTIYQFSAMGC
ncbi:MAG: hypothetical protein FD149_2324 [Rhodospirillaceae bacterium]|nr:MAG: hypothetical protein FD149_2324 [Rhodospirillaceae bacterium]